MIAQRIFVIIHTKTSLKSLVFVLLILLFSKFQVLALLAICIVEKVKARKES